MSGWPPEGIHRRWQRDERVLWRRCGDRIVLLAPGRDDVLVLDGVGRIIWEMVDRPTAHDALIAALAEHFDRPPQVVGAEVDAFIDELEAVGAFAAV